MPGGKRLTASHRHGLTGWYNLPVELRFAIYHHTWEQRRVTIDRLRRKKGPRRRKDCPLRLKIYSRPPVTLHLNAEAREETLRHYILFFKTPNRAVYFNRSLDVLHLSFFPNFNTSQSDSYSRDDLESQRFLLIIAIAKHIDLWCEPRVVLGMLQELQRDLDAEPSRFAGVHTIDTWGPRHFGDLGNDWSWSSYRLCCIPGCTAPTMHDRPGHGRLWRAHLLSSCETSEAVKRELAIREAVPFRACEDITEVDSS